MWIIVKTEKDKDLVVNQAIRIDDICDYYEDPYDEAKTIINFYKDRESLSINESFGSFSKKIKKENKDQELYEEFLEMLRKNITEKG